MVLLYKKIEHIHLMATLKEIINKKYFIFMISFLVYYVSMNYRYTSRKWNLIYIYHPYDGD